jgi:16S rRNA (cytidine1402-2'-O)-methyltransferase
MQLFLIPTPIGNLDDMTFRAINILKECDLILCEDTRVSRKLLDHYQINRPLWSYHAHNEHQITSKVIDEIKSGKKVGIISDAGTPGISDAAYLLVRNCIEEKIKVECLPGATSIIPALIQSGFPTNQFCYEGFLPHKKGRQTKIKKLVDEERTIIILESPHRILKCLNELKSAMGAERRVCVSRELTKKFEENIRGSLENVIQHFEKNEPRGEMVIVIAGKEN